MADNSKNVDNEKGGFFKNILTFSCFCLLCAASPFLFVNYCGLQFFRKLWLALLSNRFPDLEFVRTHSVRSLVDSWRNPAVINVLMEIRGTCNRESILASVSEHLLDKRDKISGQLSYQHLRRQLVSCWGNYAWDLSTTDAFDVDKHVVFGPMTHRGRPVTEANIQEYVSAMTKKYLPTNQPPWQIVLTPKIVSLEDKYYVLVRLHHLLLSKEYKINIGDFLFLKPRPKTPETRSLRSETTPTSDDGSLPRLSPGPIHVAGTSGGIIWTIDEENQENNGLLVSRTTPTVAEMVSQQGLVPISPIPGTPDLQGDSNIDRSSDEERQGRPNSPVVIRNTPRVDPSPRRVIGSPDAPVFSTESVLQRLGEEGVLDSAESDRDITNFVLESGERRQVLDFRQRVRHVSMPAILEGSSSSSLSAGGSRSSVAQSQQLDISQSLSHDTSTQSQDQSQSQSQSHLEDQQDQSSPLLDIFPDPVKIPELRHRVSISVTNFWNEFISAYDPLAVIDRRRRSIGIVHLTAVAVIVLGTVWKGYDRRLDGKASLGCRMRYIKESFSKELNRRGIDYSSIFRAVLVSANPLNIASFYVGIWWGLTKWICRIPLRSAQEVLGAISIVRRGYCSYPDTGAAILHDYVPLIGASLKEIWYMFLVLYNAPVRIFSDLLSNRSQGRELHNLQTVSLCGRKVVSWSNTVEMDIIKAISNKIGVTTSEVVLSAACGSLSHYFRETNMAAPSVIHATVRHVRPDFLLRPFSPLEMSNRDRIGGVVCLSLPLKYADNPDDCLKNLELVKNEINSTRRNQQALYCLSQIQTRHGTVTRALPAVASKLFAGYLSRKYAVTLTEVAAGNAVRAAGRDCRDDLVTQWGHEVASVMYWRPPQANISVSITFQAYGTHMRMGVMADGQLAPHHTELTSSWCARIMDMARVSGVCCDVILQVPDINAPSTSGIVRVRNSDNERTSASNDSSEQLTDGGHVESSEMSEVSDRSEGGHVASNEMSEVSDRSEGGHVESSDRGEVGALDDRNTSVRGGHVDSSDRSEVGEARGSDGSARDETGDHNRSGGSSQEIEYATEVMDMAW